MFLLLKIRQISYKDQEVVFSGTCNKCDSTETITVNLDDIDVVELPDEYRVLHNGYFHYTCVNEEFNVKVKFRFPNGADQERLLKITSSDVEGSSHRLVVSTMLEWDTGEDIKVPLSLDEFDKLPLELADWLIEQVGSIRYGPSQTAIYDCSCGNRCEATLDFASFLYPSMRNREVLS